MTPPASYARAQPAPVPQPCLAPPPVPVTPHHLSTAPLLPAPIEPRARTLRQSRLNPGSVPPPPITTIVRRRRLTRVALRRPHRAHRAPPSAAPPIAVGMSCRSGSSCRPRAAHADASRHLRAAPIPPAARTHRVQETSGTTQTTQCGHKNRIPKWGPY